MPTPATHLVLASFLLGLAHPVAAFDWDCRHSAERRATIDATGAARIVVYARAGDLTVAPGAGMTVTGHGKACASSEEYLQQTQLLTRRVGDTVEVVVRTPDDMKGIGLLYASLDLELEVPATVPVEVTDSSGDVEIHDVRLVQLTDSSGDVRLSNLPADVTIQDSSGDLRVEHAQGRVRITDSSGDIVVRGAGSVEIPTDSSGEIDIEHVAGSVRIDQDSSGDVRIADVGRDVRLLNDSSGDVFISRVKGTVQVPD